MRSAAAVSAAKIAASLTRRFRFGGGTALPGLIAERIDPDIVSELASKLGRGSVLVTGTNGKTTTARLLRNTLEAAGLQPVANRAGSNMMRGIASALVESATWSANLTSAQQRIGVFEVDEATLPEAATAVEPRVVLFTNLFRDQLDRYGEVEYVAQVWRETVRHLSKDVTLVLNADDPSVASLARAAIGKVVFYGMNDTSSAVQVLDHAADARWCSSCGAELAYDAVFYGHLGHWRCQNCGLQRPEADVRCASLLSEEEALALTIRFPAGEVKLSLPLTGLYNAYNALAAAAAAMALGIEKDAIAKGMRSFTAAFGRQERMRVAGRDVQVILAKNPAGLNQVLRTITANGSQKNVALFLNDNIADGRDISWIWDVDFELLSAATRSATVSGSRAWDMALRLKYAGLGSVSHVESDAAQALRIALKETPDGETLYVIPTYTAMLEVRDLLARWAGRAAFWEEA
jgi:UDP-N-acetylmuramyl tripeptide synthase